MKKAFKHLIIKPSKPDSVIEGLDNLLDLVQEKKYSFQSFMLDELYNIDKNAPDWYGDDVIIVYSKEEFTSKEATEYMASIIKSLTDCFGQINS